MPPPLVPALRVFALASVLCLRTLADDAADASRFCTLQGPLRVENHGAKWYAEQQEMREYDLEPDELADLPPICSFVTEASVVADELLVSFKLSLFSVGSPQVLRRSGGVEDGSLSVELSGATEAAPTRLGVFVAGNDPERVALELPPAFFHAKEVYEVCILYERQPSAGTARAHISVEGKGGVQEVSQEYSVGHSLRVEGGSLGCLKGWRDAHVVQGNLTDFYLKVAAFPTTATTTNPSGPMLNALLPPTTYDSSTTKDCKVDAASVEADFLLVSFRLASHRRSEDPGHREVVRGSAMVDTLQLSFVPLAGVLLVELQHHVPSKMAFTLPPLEQCHHSYDIQLTYDRGASTLGLYLSGVLYESKNYSTVNVMRVSPGSLGCGHPSLQDFQGRIEDFSLQYLSLAPDVCDAIRCVQPEPLKPESTPQPAATTTTPASATEPSSAPGGDASGSSASGGGGLMSLLFFLKLLCCCGGCCGSGAAFLGAAWRIRSLCYGEATQSIVGMSPQIEMTGVMVSQFRRTAANMAARATQRSSVPEGSDGEDDFDVEDADIDAQSD